MHLKENEIFKTIGIKLDFRRYFKEVKACVHFAFVLSYFESYFSPLRTILFVESKNKL